MSTLNDPPHEPSAPVLEELVAYLDGELSPDECRQVEERLANDADYREQLHELDRAWDALDSLPSTVPDDDFARTTIEMVTLAAREEQKERSAQDASAHRGRRQWWTLAAAAMVLATFFAARWFLPNANDRLLNDLPLLTQMDLLGEVESMEFLRKLSKDVPIERLATDEAAVDREASRFKNSGNKSFDVR